MQNVQRIVLVDFGAQYTQLIARRVREAKVFCEVVSYLTPLSEILEKKPVGIILSGGPASVLDADAPHIDPAIYEQGIPVLGICYGMQLTAYTLGGTVERAAQREYGRVPVDFDVNSPLFAGMKAQSVAWMSHTFHVTHAPEGFTSIAHSENCAFCAMANPEKRIYAVQFHPEVTHSEEGQKVIANFLYNVCGCTGDWTMSTFIDNAIASIREQVGPNGRVMLGLSGGVDSSVAAALISRAIGERLTCVYVDHGFMRKNETESVREVFTKQFPVNLVIVDARDRFLTKLAGVSDPETKRKLIGGEFVYCFADEAKKLEGVEFLAQGTIYPDVIESGSVKGSAVIKSHHNVGGLPADVRAQVDAAVARAEGKEGPSVLYLRATGSSCKVKNSENSVLGEMLAALGCVNIADSDASLLEELSMEAILAADPERIFIVMQGSDQEKVRQTLESAVLSNPAWQQLSAVKNGRVYYMDQQLYNLKPNARWGEAYEKLAEILYGEA